MGILVSGSMGEAHHLTPEERVILIHAAREALDSVGLTTVPVIAGTGIGSTKGTIELTRQAAEAGADYSIVIASGYYAGGLNNESLTRFFLDVAAASPIPVIVYNCACFLPNNAKFRLMQWFRPGCSRRHRPGLRHY